jgi:hypothetical protein
MPTVYVAIERWNPDRKKNKKKGWGVLIRGNPTDRVRK